MEDNQRRLQELLGIRAALSGQIASARTLSDIFPDINSVFDHEVQHAIQHIEGFAVGGNLRTVANMRLAKAEALMAQFEEVYNEYKDLEWRALNEEDLGLAMDYYDAKVEFEGAHGAEIVAYLSARQQRDNAELDIVSGMLSEQNFEEYRRLAGEVEARNVAERRSMSTMERRASLASSTEDVSREDQIIVDGSQEKAAASVERPIESFSVMTRIQSLLSEMLPESGARLYLPDMVNFLDRKADGLGGEVYNLAGEYRVGVPSANLQPQPSVMALCCSSPEAGC